MRYIQPYIAIPFRSHRVKAFLSRALAAALAAGCSFAALAAELTVSAATSLTNAFRDIAPLFEAAHPGTEVRLNFAASGVLLQQIAKGAPVDVFASADQDTMNQAQSQRLVKPAQRRDFVSNRLVVVVPAGSGTVPQALADLTRPAYRRIAIGLPASVPVGRYTRGVLESAGLWRAIEPKLVGATNVRQALDYVQRGEVDAGFVYATDAALMPDKVRVALTVSTPQPIRYPVAPLPAGPNAAMGERFVEFLFTPPAQAVLSAHGFGRP
jgi:molybdate transport system substrate-binding protein